ncbi:unnamed protein product [Thlaspi arvense]|uniref:Cyclin N-terminal domain-containing protein n=1 Tax=Thlaspi arvense TaxID=13288 RepID=A0AAU9T2Q0_THLAR|nr:unnamed protein product [Thlaspi arvense]
MDNLLCDESWLSGPLTPEPLPNFRLNTYDDDVAMTPAMDAATVDEAISTDLEKELCFSNHGDKFIEFLVSKKLTDARFQSVQWLIQEWSKWMVELVAVTALSIASKFSEVTSPSLQELQMEGLNHLFHHKTVLEMELILLKALDWRVNSVTSYSFSQHLMAKIGLLGEDMIMSRITDHLLNDLCDLKMAEYLPSVVAVAAVWSVVEEKAALEDKIMNLFGQEHKEKIAKCVNVMKYRNVEKGWRRNAGGEVKRFASMLQRGEMKNTNVDNYVGDLSAIFQILRSEGSNKKRGRDNYEDKFRPAKKMTFIRRQECRQRDKITNEHLAAIVINLFTSPDLVVPWPWSKPQHLLQSETTEFPCTSRKTARRVPKVEPKSQPAFLGFTQTAEIWNSRACMIGLIGTFIVELILNKGILELIGVEIGKGLDLPL